MKNKKLFAILTLVCFMMTLMPVAAFAAGPAVADTSAFVAEDGDQTLRVVGETGVTTATFIFKAYDNAEDDATGTTDLYIWATDANGVRTSALNVTKIDGAASTLNNVQYVYGFAGVSGDQKFTVSFARAGVYTVYAGFAKSTSGATSMSDITTLNGGETVSKITVIGSATNPEVDYKMSLNNKTAHDYTYSTKDGADFSISDVTPNNVGVEQTLTFYDGDKKLTGKTVTIETGSANIAVDKTSATTNVLGQVKFDLSASREGTYELYVTVDGVTFVINVTVGNTAAAYIETISQPSAPKAQFGSLPTVRFQITDINGNVVKDALNSLNAPSYMGMEGIATNATAAKTGKYVFFTEKPAASTLTNEDLTLSWNANKQAYDLSVGGKVMDAEGTYSVKVILDNGAFATATWEVKKFQTPVQLRIDYSRTTVELGGKISPDQIVFVDANGVEKAAKTGEYDFAATGYAIQSLSGNQITVKTDEKYVGSKINVTAVSERYDLVATVELSVADEAREIAFADKTAEVSINNKITWNVVDSQGNKVALGNDVVKTDISYVILDKPEGAKVSTYDATIEGDLRSKGEGKMALTSDKIGNVAVQVVLKATYTTTSDVVTTDNANNSSTTTTVTGTQVKYYTGTQIFAVGNGSVGDVVVMSIGSNEIIINDKKASHRR